MNQHNQDYQFLCEAVGNLSSTTLLGMPRVSAMESIPLRKIADEAIAREILRSAKAIEACLEEDTFDIASSLSFVLMEYLSVLAILGEHDRKDRDPLDDLQIF